MSKNTKSCLRGTGIRIRTVSESARIGTRIRADRKNFAGPLKDVETKKLRNIPKPLSQFAEPSKSSRREKRIQRIQSLRDNPSRLRLSAAPVAFCGHPSAGEGTLAIRLRRLQMTPDTALGRGASGAVCQVLPASAHIHSQDYNVKKCRGLQ